MQVINADVFITSPASVLSCGDHRIAQRHLIPSRTRDVREGIKCPGHSRSASTAERERERERVGGGRGMF